MDTNIEVRISDSHTIKITKDGVWIYQASQTQYVKDGSIYITNDEWDAVVNAVKNFRALVDGFKETYS